MDTGRSVGYLCPHAFIFWPAQGKLEPAVGVEILHNKDILI